MANETEVFLAVADAMPADFSTRARLHYAKAVRKHPRFADALFCNSERNERIRENALRQAERELEEMREDIYLSTRDGMLEARYLLSCEIAEAEVEHMRGNAAETISELYDAVAVLMRMIAVVEGRQKLGGEE